jgi:hypothetical protein
VEEEQGWHYSRRLCSSIATIGWQNGNLPKGQQRVHLQTSLNPSDYAVTGEPEATASGSTEQMPA